MQSNAKYHGTYPVRNIGKAERGIHMPTGLTGEFAIYELGDGTISLVPMGMKSK